MESIFIERLRPVYAELERYCQAICFGETGISSEDVLQLSLEKALSKFSQLKHPERFKSWIFKIVTRMFLSEQRRSFLRRTQPLGDPDKDEGLISKHDSSKQIDDRMLLEQALSSLSAKQRSALVLYHVSGYSVREISNLHGDLTLSATKSRLSRARLIIRKRISSLESYQADVYDATLENTKQDGARHEALI